MNTKIILKTRDKNTMINSVKCSTTATNTESSVYIIIVENVIIKPSHSLIIFTYMYVFVV